jgi:hypothetical protein
MSNKPTVLDRILAVRQDLTHNLLERETTIEAALLALLTREHLLLLGPPGTAKSLLVRSVCERIQGASYFERLLTHVTDPPERPPDAAGDPITGSGHPPPTTEAQATDRAVRALLRRAATDAISPRRLAVCSMRIFSLSVVLIPRTVPSFSPTPI